MRNSAYFNCKLTYRTRELADILIGLLRQGTSSWQYRITETFRHMSMPQVAFKPTVPMSKQVRTVHLGLHSYCDHLLALFKVD